MYIKSQLGMYFLNGSIPVRNHPDLGELVLESKYFQ